MGVCMVRRRSYHNETCSLRRRSQNADHKEADVPKTWKENPDKRKEGCPKIRSTEMCIASFVEDFCQKTQTPKPANNAL